MGGRFVIWKMCACAAAGEKVVAISSGTEWRDDDVRQVLGDVLTRLSATVVHVGPTGSCEEHPADYKLPSRCAPKSFVTESSRKEKNGRFVAGRRPLSEISCEHSLAPQQSPSTLQ